ncbi:hypothetical protein EJD97_010946, partial [Solanum chilense]
FIFHPVVDKVKMVLAGATTIKRGRFLDEVINELVIFYGTTDDDGDGVGVDDVVAVGAAVAAGQHEAASEAVNELKNKRGMKGIVSKNVWHAYTSKAKRKKESFAKAMQNLKRKIFGKIPRGVMKEVVTDYKKLNIYRCPSVAEKEYIDEILNLIRQRHWKYLDYYDPRDRILDINFYTNFLHRCNKMSDDATMSGGKNMSQLLDDFVWDDDMIDYVRGIRPTPRGMKWIDAKRILTVMNTSNNNFVTLKILLHEGLINVYDCNLVVTEHDKFFTLIQPVFELLPKLLKQGGRMNHFPEKLLIQPWEFNDRIEQIVQNASGPACGSYFIAFIEHLISRTELHPPNSLLCDNLIERMQYIWAYKIIS